MKKSVLLVLSLLVVASVPVYAKRVSGERVALVAQVPPQAEGQNCAFVEGDSFVSINFNVTEADVTKVKSTLDAKKQEIQDLAAKSGITEIELQSSNYSINANNSGNCAAPNSFQIYGSFSYKVKPVDQATALVTSLAGQGYTASMSSSSYRQCK